MYAVDFEYDGQYLSDYGFIVCDFNSSSEENIVDAGSKIAFNKVIRNGGNYFGLTSSQYNECISATFSICKNPDIYDDLKISDIEYREIFRWLNRKEFLTFRFVDDENEPRFFNASFNISKVKIREILYGIELTMETNRPFAYGEEQVVLLNFDSENTSQILYDISDEIGYIRPFITITCNDKGNLVLKNDMGDCETNIKNCKLGEIITIDNDNEIIATSVSSHDIYNDFNFDFFKIGNSYDNRVNIITCTIPCSLEIRYYPIIKDSF